MEDLISNIELLHTTPLGIERIRRNLELKDIDVIEYIKNIILDDSCKIERVGKNYYAVKNTIRITIHARSFTIITAHRLS